MIVETWPCKEATWPRNTPINLPSCSSLPFLLQSHTALFEFIINYLERTGWVFYENDLQVFFCIVCLSEPFRSFLHIWKFYVLIDASCSIWRLLTILKSSYTLLYYDQRRSQESGQGAATPYASWPYGQEGGKNWMLPPLDGHSSQSGVRLYPTINTSRVTSIYFPTMYYLAYNSLYLKEIKPALFAETILIASWVEIMSTIQAMPEALSGEIRQMC